MNYPIPAVLLALLACTLAQTPPASQGSHDAQGAFSPAKIPAKSLGMFAYPQKGQNSDQQLKDENECYGSAKQQSGVDPLAPPPPAKSADQQAAEQKAAADNAKQAKGGRARGAARGAAAGASVGLTGELAAQVDCLLALAKSPGFRIPAQCLSEMTVFGSSFVYLALWDLESLHGINASYVGR